MNEEIADLLVGSSLGEAEPVACSLVVDSEHHSAERTEILCNGDKLLIGAVGVNCKCEGNVLTVAADISHAGERLVIGSSADTALVGEVIVIRVVPLEGNVCILHYLGYSSGPLLVKGVIAVHQADASVRSAHLVEYVVLVYILASFGAVAQVNGALCLAHVDIVKVFIHGYSPPIIIYSHLDILSDRHNACPYHFKLANVISADLGYWGSAEGYWDLRCGAS